MGPSMHGAAAGCLWICSEVEPRLITIEQRSWVSFVSNGARESSGGACGSLVLVVRCYCSLKREEKSSCRSEEQDGGGLELSLPDGWVEPECNGGSTGCLIRIWCYEFESLNGQPWRLQWWCSILVWRLELVLNRGNNGGASDVDKGAKLGSIGGGCKCVKE